VIRLLPTLTVAAVAATAACHRNRTAAAPSASEKTGGQMARVDSDSLECERLRRERAAQELRDREQTRLQAVRREMQAPIYFAFDESHLSDTARGRLEANVPILMAGGATLRIVIEGHADDAGADEYNLALAQRRAAAATDAQTCFPRVRAATRHSRRSPARRDWSPTINDSVPSTVE
jgi:outer membrane protein OmpA-like peptidoglycan-associated protein